MVGVLRGDRAAAAAGHRHQGLLRRRRLRPVVRGQAGRVPRLADEYFETDRYHEFCATSLASLHEIVLDWVTSPEFDALLVDTVRATYPAHEHDQFLAHFRGLLGLWAHDNSK